jgi:hypothetical protein
MHNLLANGLSLSTQQIPKRYLNAISLGLLQIGPAYSGMDVKGLMQINLTADVAPTARITHPMKMKSE